MLATRTMGLGGEIGPLTRLNRMLHSEHHTNPATIERHQNHRKGWLGGIVQMQPAIHGALQWPAVAGSVNH